VRKEETVRAVGLPPAAGSPHKRPGGVGCENFLYAFENTRANPDGM
jgi:hypothetical protein